MVISKTRQIKVILLLAGYLLVVISHLNFVQALKIGVSYSAFNKALLVSKVHDKLGRGIVTVKRIYKTVINRNMTDLKGKALALLYVATILHDVSFSALQNTYRTSYLIPLTNLPISRSYNLRI